MSKNSSKEQKEFDIINLFKANLNCFTSCDNSLIVFRRWLYVLIHIVSVMLNKMRETHSKGEMRKAYKILAGKPEEEAALGTTLCHCQN